MSYGVFIKSNGKWVAHWTDITKTAADAEVAYLASCGLVAQAFVRVAA